MEEKLIEAVRIRQVLYDTSHVDYMRTKLKTEKWEEIAKEVGMKTGTEAKALWEKLRHSLRDAIRRQQKCCKSGAPAVSIKEWKFQKQMGFLQPYMAHKSREGNLREDDEDENLAQDSEQNVTPAEVDTEIVGKVNMRHQDENVEDQSQPQKLSKTLPSMRAATPTSNATPNSAKKAKKDVVTALLKQSMKDREERAKARKEERRVLQDLQPTQNDPLFHFFMSMYQSTKRMPPSYQHTVRNHVFNVVSDVEAKLIDIRTNAVQQRPYYQYLSGPHAANQSYSSSSSTPAYSYSDNSLLSPADIHEEQENSTAASSVSLMNYINTFTEK